MLIVTHAELKKIGACEEERELFRRYATHGIFRRRVQFETLEALMSWCLIHKRRFNWSWAAYKLMSVKGYNRYINQTPGLYKSETAVIFARCLWEERNV